MLRLKYLRPGIAPAKKYASNNSLLPPYLKREKHQRVATMSYTCGGISISNFHEAMGWSASS
ncbi:MAG: hypothetical protein ACTS73_04220 [Arsenophonus sp. NEOnobi-MAG3]